ncbi:EAL domain-containing response regulator [Lysobacter sp. A3-1-A15]|uniref:EAL domain-containing response regulator n=1 Tax=Novilysobacter viscosus TaxID=3098602 RepID=UPI002EDA4EEA
MSLSALHVLVLEDHGFQRRLAIRLLNGLGVVHVHEAADGAAALDLLERLEVVPDIILVDLDMPGMDGIEFISHVAQRKLSRGVAVVSALDPALINTVQTVARGYGLHILGSIQKPLTAARLEDMLASYEECLQGEPECPPVAVDADDLHAALAGGGIQAWFQPQVEFANGRVVSVEVLARWPRGDGAMVGPARFVPMLERDGLANALTDGMLEQACRWKKQWEAHGLRLRVSVNMSSLSFADPGIVDHLQALVRQHGVEPAEVMLEITESSLMAHSSLGVLARLRLKGFGLSIDDFGTGYSSLTQLSEIPFTELKIDRGFVLRAHEQPRKRAVIEASIELARKMGLSVVAEGVETVEEWQMLSELGCDTAQGFLISHAVPGADLTDVVTRWRQPGC